MPAGWAVRHTSASVAARKGGALVSATAFRLLKEYDPGRFGPAAQELDGLAARLAGAAGASLSERATTTVDGRKVRAYRYGNLTEHTRIGFFLEGRREVQLLCRAPAGAGDPDGACTLLFSSFRAR